MPFKKRTELKNIKTLVAKYYLFGLITLVLVYAIIGEIPSWYTVERDWIEWTITIISVPIVGILVSKFLSKYVGQDKRKYFGLSFIALFISWILILYLKAFAIGIINSFELERIRILESLAGYSIYQLWIYGLFGIVHGLVGGYFLSKELTNYEEKTAHNNI